MDAAIEELEYTIGNIEHRIEDDMKHLNRNQEWLTDSQSRVDQSLKRLQDDQLLLDSLRKALVVLKDYNDS